MPSQAAIDAATAKQQQERPPANAVEKAIAEAKATQKNVPVDSLTTEFSETVATPEGHLALTSHLEQQRVRRNGVWQGLDATLVANQDGTFSPKSAAGQLALSKGGDGPLATMTSSDGKKLALSAPFKLPAATVSGDSVVYPSVAPDIDLKVTATKLGGLTTVLVVKTQAAAANPALKNLHFGTTVDGVSVKTDEHGNVTVVGADGKPRWVSRTPQMWDSSTTPAASTAAPTAKAARSLAAAAPTDSAPAAANAGNASSDAGPGTASKVSTMPVKADDTGITLTPDQDLLAHGTAPYYIDPDYLPWTLTGNSWTWVQSAHDGSNNWMRQGSGDADHPGVGVCGYYPNGGSCSPADIERSFYQFDISALAGAVIHSATMTMQEYVSADWSCTNKYPLNLYVTGPIGNGIHWSNQPGQVSGPLGDTALVGGSGQDPCHDNVPFSFDITGAMKQYVNYGQLTFGLYGDESNQYAFKRFTYQPALSVTYDRVPNVPTNPSVWPAPRTVVPAAANQSCGDGNANDWAWLGAGSAQNNAVWLNGTVSSPTQPQVMTWDHIWDYNSSNGASGTTAAVNSGGTTSFQLPASLIQDGHAYGYDMQATDGLGDTPWSAPTPNCYFKVDLTPPTVTFPTTVADTSKQFPPSGNGQTPQIYAGQSGGIPFTATDPNPSGGYTSGVVCLRWSFDPQLVDAAWQCGSAMPSGQIQVTAGRWGTNVLYVQAEDNAGNLSPVAQYAFYAPWNPNSPAPTFGDVTGDALPDIVTADPNGDLRAYSIPATAAKAPLAAPKATSPYGDSWANYRITHRGSLRGGNNVDDLIVHKDGDKNLWYYQNPGNAGVTGVFDANNLLAKPACDPQLTDCTGYNTVDWSTVQQIAASGDPSTTKLDTNKKFLNRTGLFTVETSPDGTGALWFYPTIGDGTFGSPTKLAATGWKGWDLISPGDWAGQGHPGLWARNQNTGDLRGYTFTTGTITVTDDFGNTTNYPTLTGIASDTKIGWGIPATTWPLMSSDGDLTGTGTGSPTLWDITSNGIIQIWTGHATTTAPYFTWDRGPDNVLSVYAENSPITYGAQTGKCMDIYGANTAPGTAVQLWDCNSNAAQNWTFKPDGTLRALGGCLDAAGAGTTNGTPLEIWTCGNASPNQIFLPRPDGSLYNPASGRCVDLPGAVVANNARLQLWDCNPAWGQKWNPLVRS
ncbi:ricin-type beta-trefoil lectin domain protein [Kitasatospora cathayae]|uniref:Ricin-type beta-trefoil lectin domain protein n=1 Tax=Kitasatospora cathayae TaxID=3004092 RepID=A0ABY7QBW4_9ACTN|nr:ricin-type beta-trefoil lectin domain protein [Kitasatospora sp. HUAS 3-15]WBP90121.1 ricin-type beta-trefoil lectin domain protein [Kitasatospora sp. HUAS 3-15]